MSEPATILMVGQGRSMTPRVRLPRGYPVAAISGGHRVLDRPPDHLITLDRPEFFPGPLLCSDRVTKHTHDGRSSFDVYPRVVKWPYTIAHQPVFDPAEGAPLASGTVFNSMLFAVQVVACMGFRRLWFFGCDLAEAHYQPMLDCLEAWHGIAAEQGITWINGSPRSRLTAFLPTQQREEVRS